MTLFEALYTHFPSDRVLVRQIERIAFASDASFYRLIPKAVVQPQSINDIRALFTISHSLKVPLTFRSAGTSLSGQAVTDGILADTARYWKDIHIEDDGLRVKVQPGVIAGHINQRLEKYHRRIGPDPSSINSASIGGILANNSGGKSVTIENNAYGTIDSLSFVLPNGVFIDLNDHNAAAKLESECPEITKGLMQIKDEIKVDSRLADRIRTKYQVRNTMGYSLNAFLDFDTPLEIIKHLMIGSEGTLGFISEAVIRTIPCEFFKYVGLLFFRDLKGFADAVGPVLETQPQVLEFMDRKALRNVQDIPGSPKSIRGLPETALALYAEYPYRSLEALTSIKHKTAVVCSKIEILAGSEFAEDPGRQKVLSEVRNQVVPETFARHPRGTIAQIEDVTVPVLRVAEIIADLQQLFMRHEGCEDMIIFGHLPFGSVHFIITPSFNNANDIQCYERFMNDVADLVLQKYDGSLKGEHATGRSMAPYLEAEWGSEIYEIMKRIKKLFDPENLLNPGVIINADPKANLRNLKSLPRMQSEVDLCIECGHCEWVCPSLNLTMSPRQRIVVQREIQRLKETGDHSDVFKELVSDYRYDGIETCAADGMCACACPVKIDTGMLTRRLRAEKLSSRKQTVATLLSHNYKHLESGIRAMLKIGHLVDKLVGEKMIYDLTQKLEKNLRVVLPKWHAEIRRPFSGRLPQTDRSNAKAVYFPSCITRILGTSAVTAKPSVIETFVVLAERARLPVWIPQDVQGCCCGMPFYSKGYLRAYREILHRTLNKMWQWSQEGRLPIFMDISSCVSGLRSCENILTPEDFEKWSCMTIMDPNEFIHDMLLCKLKVKKVYPSVVLHPNCSAVKLGSRKKMEDIARQCAKSVSIPLNHNCCGYAGDRGLLFPELTESATRAEAEEILSREYDGYYSTNLPCEMGLSKATGKSFEALVYLVEEASR